MLILRLDHDRFLLHPFLVIAHRWLLCVFRATDSVGKQITET